MDWTKSPPALVEQFGRLLQRFPEAERRQMFGYPAAFVGGNLVTSLHRDSWIVRVPDAERAAATAAGATPFEPMPGRPMTGYYALPADVLGDEEQVAAWVSRAIEHGRTMPPKAKRRRGAPPTG